MPVPTGNTSGSVWRSCNMTTALTDSVKAIPSPTEVDEVDLPVARIGIVAGIVGMLCCVGPTVLALVGVISAAAAADLANGLYGDYAWYFRSAGLLVGAGLVAHVLRKRGACSIRGVMSTRRKIGFTLLVAVGSYGVLYALTTWLGSFA
jgi:hypothetical protein